MTDLESGVRWAIRKHLPGRDVVDIRDRGVWGRQIVQVVLDGGEVVVIKISPRRSGWLEGGETQELKVARLLAQHGIDVVPPVLAVDGSCEILPDPYMIQAYRGGTRLGTLLTQSPGEGSALYEAVGRLYAGIHAIHNDRDGLWNGTSPDTPWGAPTEHMGQANIVEGAGQEAVEAGCLTERTHARAGALWRAAVPYLLAHQPSMVHVSPFLWTIYLERTAGAWRVVKLMSVGDFLWWDPAYDVACLRYPPFGEMPAPWWEGFLSGYGPEPELKRLLLYAVLQRLMAAMGAFMQPNSPANAAWMAQARQTLEPTISAMLDQIEILA